MNVPAIEPRVENICAALNELPGIDTFSSCGGHANPDKATAQAPLGEFWVCFTTEWTEDSWRSLQVIVWACALFDSWPEGSDSVVLPVTVKPWFNGIPGEDGPFDASLDFELRGDVEYADRVANQIQFAMASVP